MNTLHIYHIASGSQGNAILIGDGVSWLLLDAGISHPKLQKELHQRGLLWKNISGVLITHSHGDHIKAVQKMLWNGQPEVYIAEAEARNANLKNPMKTLRYVKSLRKETIGTFEVWPFPVKHNTPEPYGFRFRSTITGAVGVYIADTNTYPTFRKDDAVHYWIVECNYAEDLLHSSVYPDSVKDRIRRDHMCIENVLSYFRGVERIKEAQSIILVHLSDSNSNAEQFSRELEKVTGVPVFTP